MTIHEHSIPVTDQNQFGAAEKAPPEYDRLQVMQGIAQQLIDYSLEIEPGDTLLIKFDSNAREILPLVLESAQKAGAKVLIQYSDAALDRTLLESVSQGQYRNSLEKEPDAYSQQLQNGMLGALNTVTTDETGKRVVSKMTDDQFTAMTEADMSSDEGKRHSDIHYLVGGPEADEIHFLSQANKVLVLASRQTLEGFDVAEQVEDDSTAMHRVLIDERVNNRRWCLFRPPTEAEAKSAKMSFKDYERMCFEACNRDWEAVEKAQAVLVEMLRSTDKITVTVPPPPGMDDRWATHFELEVTGKIAANSVAKRNMPGSEVFLSPNIKEVDGKRIGTLTGKYALPYPVMMKNRVVPNLILEIENGKVIHHEVYTVNEVDGAVQVGTERSQVDYDHVERLLNTDEGARWIGEFAIGTNPAIKIPILNTLFVEKILGVHIALGKAYTYTNYLGQEVNVDNGNRSANHIDITRIMNPTYGGGTISFDGAEIFRDGKFLDPRLQVLNQ